MSIKGEITRIQNNVSASLSALQEKGVSVPSGATSDSLPGLIAQVSGRAEVEETTNSAGGKTVYINSEPEKLPEGFTRLKWIQSDGRQYVNTLFKPNNNSRILLDYENTGDYSAMTADVAAFFGARKGTQDSAFGMWLGEKTYPHYGSISYSANGYFTVNINQRLIYDFNKNVVTVGGETITCASATFSSDNNLYIFEVNQAGVAYNRKSSGKLYSCQIYDNGTLVRNYIPCLNASGEAGLYDFVTQAFFGDAAGVGFIAGEMPEEVELPDGYTQVEYIQTNGDNWIDTGIYPSGTTRVVADTDLLGGDTYPTLFGAWTDGNSGKYIFLALSNTTIRSYYGTTETDATVSIYGRHVVEQNKGNAYVDGVQYVSKANSSFTTSQTMYIGTFHGGETSGTFGAVAKYYSVQIYQGSTLVRDFVPCTNASGVGGMYDMVNGVFYTAGGTGAFVVGSAVSPGVSKVVLEDEVLIDLTGDTVTPKSLLSGFTAHDAMGQLIQGAASAGSPFASGIFTPTSNVATMTISGLNFAPKIVLVVAGNGSMPWINNYQYALAVNAHDDERGLQQKYYGFVDSYGYASGAGASGSGITLNASGFTGYAGSYYYYKASVKYYWYAIGAEG